MHPTTAIDQDLGRSTPSQRSRRRSAPAAGGTQRISGHAPSRVPIGRPSRLQRSGGGGRPSSAAIHARVADGGRGLAPVVVEQGIERARGGGRQLEKAVRGDLQQWFSTDLRRVRVHADSDADRLARAVDAIAFTVEFATSLVTYYGGEAGRT